MCAKTEYSEPWELMGESLSSTILDSDQKPVFGVGNNPVGGGMAIEEKLARIVACVNICKGHSTEEIDDAFAIYILPKHCYRCGEELVYCDHGRGNVIPLVHYCPHGKIDIVEPPDAD